MTTKRRFIAGAVCPRCAEMDKLVMYREAETTYRECISCGYEDSQTESSFTELKTRVNQVDAPEAPSSAAGDIAVVRILEPGK